jgi:hypothetical protein
LKNCKGIDKGLDHIRESILTLSEIYDQQGCDLDFQKILLTLDLSKGILEGMLMTSDLSSTAPACRANKNALASSVKDLMEEVQSMIRGLAECIPTMIPISLSEQTAERITYEQIKQNPQSAIQYVFTLLEEHLRRRTGVGPDLYGEKLINRAFGGTGCLMYGELPAEQLGVRNLMSGAYATLRGPRIHRVVEDDEHRALTIIALVDLLMQIVDEAEDKDRMTC